MPTRFLKTFAILLTLGFMLAACNDKDDGEESSDLDPNVDTPAYPVLEAAGTLHLFSVKAFSQASNIFNDEMELFIDNFSVAASTEEPDEDEDDLSENDLGYTRLIWSEIANEEKTALLAPMEWLLDSSPLLDSRFTNNDREYRILENGELSAVYSSDYKPLYEAIDDNIYERHQSVVFVWDFGGAPGLDAEEDVGNDEIADWQSRSVGGKSFAIIPHAEEWGQDADFSSGARIYAATRSVAKDITVIEGVYADGSFDLDRAKVASGVAVMEDVLDSYNLGTQPLEFSYSVDFFTHRSLKVQFDTIGKKAYLFIVNNASLEEKVVVDYVEYPDKAYMEINTAALPKSVLDTLNLPAYFNPVIAGPFGEGNDYYYGKRYIKTDATQRLKLEPVFFLNGIASDDVESAFEEWRIERHEEEE